MDDKGTAELIKLEELLRIGLDATRKIAFIRPNDFIALMDIVSRAEQMADDLERIIQRSNAARPQ